MGKRFVLGRDESGAVALQSSHEIGSVSDMFALNARGITEVRSADAKLTQQADLGMTNLPIGPTRA